MKTTFKLLASLLMLTPCANAAWKVEKDVDEMTDEVSYTLDAAGDQVKFDFIQYTPHLIVRILPKQYDTFNAKLIYKPEVFFTFEADGINRNGIGALVRFDEHAAETWEFSASTDRRAAFFEAPLRAIEQLRKSNEVRIRFKTTLGEIRTLHFDTSGFVDAMHQVKKRVVDERPFNVSFGPIAKEKPKTTPPPATATPPAPAMHPPTRKTPTRCPYCNGKGTRNQYETCPECQGSGRSGNARCPRCKSSIRRGMIKSKCLRCSGSGSITK